MKNLLSTFGKHTTRALCCVAVCGLTWACSDDFTLDDEKPSWLNSSIYDGLKDDGRFTNYIELLEDKAVNPTDPVTGEYLQRPLSEVLSRTGSKTVFVARDDAWDAFYKHNATLPESNPWHNATSYANLSVAQKKLLIHTSMLNNAIVMENLASSDGGTDADGNQTSPIRGEYMRRFTDVMLTDTITFLRPEEVPWAYNASKTYPAEYNEKGELTYQYVPEPNYWKRFSDKTGGKGVYIVTDSTANMMLHFTSEHMSKQEITDGDFEIIMGRSRKPGDVHIYDALLLSQDSVAQNGYINQTEKVIAPLPNMAEVIRTCGLTNIFSHILDRFSFPYYNEAVTEAYKTLHPEFKDSIFTKKYFAQLGMGHKKDEIYGPDGEKFQDSDGDIALRYNPGWNGYYDEADLRKDMASMFVPSDETLWEYFSEGGGGWELIKTYAQDPNATVNKGDYAALFNKIDDIPLSTLQALVNVIMFRSFNGSVPSKMTKLRDDAQEDLFTPDDIANIDTCLLACNGAVYVMSKVYGPADFTSVAAPAYISKSNRIMKWAIYNGSVESEDLMHINYFAYLKAMKSKFTFFLPSDEALKHYYDPISFTSQKSRVLELRYTGSGKFPLDKTLYEYDVTTGLQGAAYPRTENISQDEIVNRLKDMLESHTIVHDANNPLDSEDEYYIAKNGSGIKVTRDANNEIIKVQGGFQLENERRGITSGSSGTTIINVPAGNKSTLSNGTTFVLDDSPIIPASTSVYGVLNEDATTTGKFQGFYTLTLPNDSIIEECGLVPATVKSSDRTRLLSKYHTFIDRASTTGNGGGVDFNIQFFNNYRYTLFVPTNEAILAAEANGLPTWESIEADWHSMHTYGDLAEQHPETQEWYVINDNATKDTIWLSDIETRLKNSTRKKNVQSLMDDGVACFLHSDSLRLQAKVTYINNFIRGHFLDNSVFADKTARTEAEYVTSSYNSEYGVFVKVHVTREGDGVLKVRDDNGGSSLTVTENKNLMARDVICTRNGKNQSPYGQTTMNNIIIQGSSFCVIHQIPGVLNHTALDANGQYGLNWNDASECKAYLSKYPIVDTNYDVQTAGDGEEIARKKIVIR
ncbi:MAG: hypothetical protein K6C30_01600 [Bacteroidaceae bacterium]|nr:hypothetical protein [Bacteroidaceae bacterium]